MPATHRSTGFTLIELLVVLVLIGLLAALATLTLGGTSQLRQMDNEVRDLFLMMQTASEQAILNNSELALVVDEEGYQFQKYDELAGTWVATSERLFAARNFPEWMSVITETDDELPRLPTSDDEPRPNIVFFSSGQTTPFLMEFTLDEPGAEPTHEIAADGTGSMALTMPGEQAEFE